jgi:hypothetical protein
MVGDSGFSWKSDDKTEKAVASFVERWRKRGVHEESLGVNFLYDYFCDTYNYWTDGGRNKRQVPLGWVIGEPQLSRWDNKIEEYKFSYTEQLFKNCNIPPISEVKRLLTPNTEPTKDQSEEYERQRFFNSAEGMVNCLLTTTLYDSKSKWCPDCKYSQDCIEELKIRDKRTALRRGVLKL